MQSSRGEEKFKRHTGTIFRKDSISIINKICVHVSLKRVCYNPTPREKEDFKFASFKISELGKLAREREWKSKYVGYHITYPYSLLAHIFYKHYYSI
jgi:hypothetical protein